MGGAVAMFINGEGEQPVRSWSLGRRLLQFDTDAFALARMAQSLALYYTDEVCNWPRVLPLAMYPCKFLNRLIGD